MQSTAQFPSRRAGFSLIGLAVALTAASLILVSVLPGNDANKGFNKSAATNMKRLDVVEQAIQSFMAKNGRLA